MYGSITEIDLTSEAAEATCAPCSPPRKEVPRQKIKSLMELVADKFGEHFNISVDTPPVGGTTLHSTIFKSLAEGEWADDDAMDFDGSYIYTHLDKGEQSRVHIFSTHFYTKFTDEGYKEVKRWTWTRKANRIIDLFTKDYVLVPIHTGIKYPDVPLERVHWILAIICHPNQLQQQAAQGQPCILVLDSKSGGQYGKDVPDGLRAYLTEEWEASGRVRFEITDKELPHYFIKQLPTQDNDVDCGLFMMTSMEHFLTQMPPKISLQAVKDVDEGRVRPLSPLFTKGWYDIRLPNLLRTRIAALIFDRFCDKAQGDPDKAEAVQAARGYVRGYVDAVVRQLAGDSRLKAYVPLTSCDLFGDPAAVVVAATRASRARAEASAALSQAQAAAAAAAAAAFAAQVHAADEAVYMRRAVDKRTYAAAFVAEAAAAEAAARSKAALKRYEAAAHTACLATAAMEAAEEDFFDEMTGC